MQSFERGIGNSEKLNISESSLRVPQERQSLGRKSNRPGEILGMRFDNFSERAERTKNLELAKKIWRRESYQVGQSTIDSFGVHHEPETFELFRRELEEGVKKTDLVVLEGAPQAQGYFSEQHLARMKVGDKEGKLKRLKRNSATAFFAYIENLAGKYGKQIAVVDPKDGPDGFFNPHLGGYDKVFGKGILKEVGLAALGTGIYNAPKLVDRQGEDVMSQQSNSTYSRRNILKILGGAVGVYGAARAGINMQDQTIFGRSLTRKPGQAALETLMKPYMHAIYDFRDVVAAEGIQQLINRQGAKLNIMLVCHTGHSISIRDYLEKPKLRAEKFNKYKDFREFLPCFSNTYKFNGNNWELANKVEIAPHTI